MQLAGSAVVQLGEGQNFTFGSVTLNDTSQLQIRTESRSAGSVQITVGDLAIYSGASLNADGLVLFFLIIHIYSLFYL
jgi:hypothetical protein